MAPSSSSSPFPYLSFGLISVLVLKELNEQVWEPYMDEPFHVGQAQAYCRDEWSTWDPKITTPPGLYILSVLLKKSVLFKCNLAVLRLTPLIALLSLPILLARLLSYHSRERPPRSVFAPRTEAVVLSTFPIAWFFGFLYYTDVPSLAFVLATAVAACEGRHILAGILGLLSCTFRQTNIVWVLYAFAYSQVTYLRWRRPSEEAAAHGRLHDPLAELAGPSDLIKSILSVPSVIPDIWKQSIPYVIDIVLFVAFVVWNGGIVLGDKSNHIPSLHIPQIYYFIGFTTLFGWPVLLSGPGGPSRLIKDVKFRMFGSVIRTAITGILCILIGVSVHRFTIHHPFLLSDNRHYTFYIWRRIFLFHPAVPYLFAPVYLTCAWAWFIRLGTSLTLLQTLLLPLCALPTLLMTPLLEPRYFLIPYVLLRAQIVDVVPEQEWFVWIEGAWYMLINGVTMYVFLYKEREGVGRFMW